MSLDAVLTEIERDVIFFDDSCGGVTLSGGEPLLQSRFASALLRACRERRIHTVLETCGFAHHDRFLNVAELAKVVLFDLKVLDPERHQKYTGVSNTSILSNLEKLITRGRTSVIVRIPVVPGINNTNQDICQFTEYLAQLRIQQVHLLRYHRTGTEKYKRLGLPFRLPHTPEASETDMERFAAPLRHAGLSVTIGG